MFSLSVDCKHFKDSNFNMINYKGYETNPCNPINSSTAIVGRKNVDPDKIVISCDDLKTTLKDEGKVCIADTGNKINLESKDGFHNYYSDKDVFS